MKGTPGTLDKDVQQTLLFPELSVVPRSFLKALNTEMTDYQEISKRKVSEGQYLPSVVYQ